MCGKDRVARLRRWAGIEARRKRKFRLAYKARNTTPVPPNLLRWPFKAGHPDQIWVTDVTFIPTRSGWLYLAALIDLHTCLVVGWSMKDRPNQELVNEAVDDGGRTTPPQTGTHSPQCKLSACQACVILFSHNVETMPRHPRVHVEGLLYHVIARGNNGQISICQQSDYRHSDRAPALPVLCLYLCLDVEPLPFIVGSSSLPDSAHSAIATHRLRAAVAFAHGARPFRCRALPAAAEPCLSAWPSLGIDRQRTVKRCSDVEIAD